MQFVQFSPLGKLVSRIGFGCGSLGSRVSPKRGRFALDAAYDQGVDWYDVAPSYGDGNAEQLLGEFSRSKRAKVSICTKVGLLPPRISPVMRIAKPIVRAGLSMFPALRRHIVKRRPSVQSQPITGPLIESSIAESLRRLRTDYVDVLAVHNPDKFDLSRHDVCMALDNVIRRGYARRVGIAGDRIAVDARTIAALKITVLQFADGPFNSSIRSLGVLATSQTMGFVTHSVFGHDGCLDILLGLLATDRRLSAALDDLGYRGEARSRAAAFLLDYALGNNPDGVVLLSMYDKQHRTFNLSPDRGRVAITVLRSLISQHMIPSAGPAKAEAWN